MSHSLTAGVRSKAPSVEEAHGASLDLSTIYRAEVRYVWRSLRHLGVKEADLEDVCHDVFLVVQRQLPTFEGRSRIRTWLYGICLRSASDYRRRACYRREIATDTPPERTCDADQERGVQSQQVRVRLLQLLDRLPDEQRDVFVLYEVEELSMKDVAEVVGCPLQTAYSRLHASRKRLAALLQEPAS